VTLSISPRVLLKVSTFHVVHWQAYNLLLVRWLVAHTFDDTTIIVYAQAAYKGILVHQAGYSSILQSAALSCTEFPRVLTTRDGTQDGSLSGSHELCVLGG
jgi:hypothetical protein